TGRWTVWQRAAPEAEDLPDRPRGSWRLGNPYWVGASDRIVYRLHGRVTRLRAYFVQSPEERIPLRRASMTGSPPPVSRAAWGANEAIRRAAPSYARSLQFAVVHHTAGSNSYTAAQSAAIVRGIDVYHVKGNGWNDIGYNFLVDKYGQVFEGRYGGVDKNVVGAHAGGFKAGSVGVALIGTYQSTAPAPAGETALVNPLAWRPRVAARRGSCRSPVDAVVFVRRQCALSRRHSGVPAGRFRSSRHRIHDLPWRRALRATRRARTPGRDDGSAEALCTKRAGAARRP